MLDMKRVGEFIAALRKARGLTQSALADLLCVTHQAVSKWENGASLPDPDVLIAMRGVFGVSVDSILDGRTPEVSDPSTSESKSTAAVTGTCMIVGTAHFETEFASDSVEIIGTARFDGSLTANTLSVAGSADVSRQVEADEISVTGSLSAAWIHCQSLANVGQTKCGGGMKVADSLTNRGCVSVGGGANARILDNVGTMNVGGGCGASSMKNHGNLTVGGGLSANSFLGVGDLTVGGGLGGDSIETKGPFDIGGGIRATSVSVFLPTGDCAACWITTDKLVVEKSTYRPSGILKVREIRADHAELENVHADTAMIQTGSVGGGCKIARLECGPDVEVLQGAEICETVRSAG